MVALLALASLGSSMLKDTLLDGWKNVPQSARARMYWRVFGPAWDKDNIDRQLKIVKSAGLGGVMTYFMYPFALDEPGKWHNQVFNSPEFLENLGYAVKSAKKLGLRFGVCGSTGWPYGGSKVTVEDSAQMLKKVTGTYTNGVPKFKEPYRPNEGDRIIAVFQDGKRTESPTNGTATAFVAGPTRMQVKRPSLGNEGLVVDHLNKNAVERYLHSTVAPMLDQVPKGVESIFSDSLEVYRQNWTHDFPAQFHKMRGYDIVPHLYELFEDSNANAKPLRQDFWRTVAELAEERYVRTVYDWAHTKGATTELQPYGTPPLPMTSSAYIDIPTGEHYEWMGFNVCRYVASAAHQEGKNLVGSEAWTWGAIPNRLTDSLSDLKLMSDMHFASGVNDITGVDYPYSPKAAGIPGWLPYYGPSVGETNPQWAVFPELVSYLNRCSWMLRQGKPASKVAVYLPIEDGMADGGTEQLLLDFAVRDHFVTGPLTSEFGLTKAMNHHSDLVETLMKQAIDFDGVDFWSINKVGKVNESSMTVGSASYRVVILPRIESIELDSLRKLEAACKSGVTLVATGFLPSRASGMTGQAGDREVRDTMKRLFSAEPSRSPKTSGTCRTYFVNEDRDLDLLRDLDVAQAKISDASGLFSIVRRDLSDGEVYFCSNPSSQGILTEISPNPARKYVEIWDPMTGEVFSKKQAPLQVFLNARGSLFIVSRDHPTQQAKGESKFYQSLNSTDLLPLGGWDLSFNGPDEPPGQHLETPVYWETLPGCDHFSGEGIYRTRFEFHAPKGSQVLLGLHEIRNAAQVFINNKKVGSVWLPPYEIDISRTLHPGSNELEIRVYNSMANRFIGLPDADIKGLRAKYGNRFSAPEEKELMKGPESAGMNLTPYFVVHPRMDQ